jgi:membrane protein implicated in regulation of membrane protease activity
MHSDPHCRSTQEAGALLRGAGRVELKQIPQGVISVSAHDVDRTMDYEVLAILLLMVGFSLIVAEIFIPSGGLILIMCVFTFAASFWFAWKAWYGTSSLAFGAYITALLVLIPAVVVGAFKFFPLTPMGKRLIGAPTIEEVTPYAQEQAHLQSLIGRIGKSVTPLIPGGLVSVEGERLHAFTEGGLVDPGVDVEIIDVRGTRVVVREAEDLPPASTGERTAGDEDEILAGSESEEDEDPLDFGLPQS